MYDKITLFALHRNDFGFGYAYKLIYKWQSAVFLDIFPHIFINRTGNSILNIGL